jgi:hypothetical protein
MKLYPPGTRKGNASIVARFRYAGRYFEISTGCLSEELALACVEQFKARYDEEALRGALRPPRAGQARPIGEFESFLLENYRLQDGRVVDLDGKPVYGQVVTGGFAQVRVKWQGEVRSVLMHRLVFLLHWRWLPAVIEHIDGNPANNDPINLRAMRKAKRQRNPNWAATLKVRAGLQLRQA